MALSGNQTTRLIVAGIPGPKATFTAKDEAVHTGPPRGSLMLMGAGR